MNITASGLTVTVILCASWAGPLTGVEAASCPAISANTVVKSQSGANGIWIQADLSAPSSACREEREVDVAETGEPLRLQPEYTLSVGGTPVINAAPRDSDLDALCVRTALGLGNDPFSFCDLPADPTTPTATVPPALAPAPAAAAAAAPTLTPGMVAEAFRSVDLPASELAIEPPGGRTLVNFATNFYTEQGSFTREVELLGQRVELWIWPSRFAWRFGDGRSLVTREPGSPYPALEITHEYGAKGGVHPSVDTTYAARFRVNGGAWRDVDGTVTIPGAPVDLEVVTATPELVGYR